MTTKQLRVCNRCNAVLDDVVAAEARCQNCGSPEFRWHVAETPEDEEAEE